MGIEPNETSVIDIPLPSEKEGYKTFPETTCPICLEPMNGEKSIKQLECYHVFHDECINKWFTKNTTCPQCRHIMSQQIVSNYQHSSQELSQNQHIFYICDSVLTFIYLALVAPFLYFAYLGQSANFDVCDKDRSHPYFIGMLITLPFIVACFIIWGIIYAYFIHKHVNYRNRQKWSNHGFYQLGIIIPIVIGLNIATSVICIAQSHENFSVGEHVNINTITKDTQEIMFKKMTGVQTHIHAVGMDYVSCKNKEGINIQTVCLYPLFGSGWANTSAIINWALGEGPCGQNMDCPVLMKHQITYTFESVQSIANGEDETNAIQLQICHSVDPYMNAIHKSSILLNAPNPDVDDIHIYYLSSSFSDVNINNNPTKNAILAFFVIGIILGMCVYIIGIMIFFIKSVF